MSTFKRDILLATILATVTASVNQGLHVLFAQLRVVPAQAQAAEAITIGGPVAPDGKTEVACDLPTSERIKNIGSRVDGAGMCVDSSIEMAAHWAGLEELRGFRDWVARKPGGGYPEKVAQHYPPDHWAIQRVGFVTTGKATIYLQGPDGTVLHHQDDYRDGADGLANALRRIDPH